MNTCGTCKHFGEQYELDWWDSDTDTEGTVTKFHVCKLIKHINESSMAKKAAQDQVAGAIDGSGYHAAFCVSEEFGCNQWAERLPDQP